MTIVDFCARESLKPTTYHYWQREINRRDAEPQSSHSELPSGESAGAALAAVRVIDDSVSPATVEVIARNGYVVRIAEQATAEHVRRVLQAVSELD